MKKILLALYNVRSKIGAGLLSFFVVSAGLVLTRTNAEQVLALPEPVVAIHVSELTQALQAEAAAWPYFVDHESLAEALRSDGTPFVIVTDSDIAAGKMLNADGSPHYPILISLAAAAIADNEIAPLRGYVAAGGFLFAGASSFTRRPDGTSRGDFALAPQMGIHTANPDPSNWYLNDHFTKIGDHRLTRHIPNGTLSWSGPLTPEEIPWGVSPDHPLHARHTAWQVNANDATVVASGDEGPLLTLKEYGQGFFIYDAETHPLIHDATDPGMYAYLIFRRAIEWAFEASRLPIVRLSPWPYRYDAAFIARHDFENNTEHIRAIEASAEFEQSLGVKGDYYFSTGAVRVNLEGDAATIASLKRAVAEFGATIGSHNGGLKNPVNSELSAGDYDYWHWGPDEALDSAPPGYQDGKAYAYASLLASFQDLEGWLAGLDNGRAGCGGAGTCPRTWVSPYGNSAREDSRDILEQVNAITMGEQKISPFPQRTLSYAVPGKYFSPVTIPISDWYVGSHFAQGIDPAYGSAYHTGASIKAAVDFYYDLGALINFYGHSPSNNGGVEQEYVTYSMTKPAVWSTNAPGIADWWRSRSTVLVVPAISRSGSTFSATASISGATDPETAIEMVMPAGYVDLRIFINDAPADPSEYRTTGYGVKVRVGTSGTDVKVSYSLQTGNTPPTAKNDTFSMAIDTVLDQAAPGVLSNDADPEGAALTAVLVSGTSHGSVLLNADGSFSYMPAAGYTGSDSFTYAANDGATTGDAATVTITVAATGGTLFSDDFTRQQLPPWSGVLGTWTITNGVLQGSSGPLTYAIAWYDAPLWSDYSVGARIQLPAGAFGGGIGGRVNAATGARYTAAVYPEGSAGGSNVLKLVKFRDWTTWNYLPMKQVSLPGVGTGWHALAMTFKDARIQVYYDGVLMIDVTDDNYDSRAPYLGGGVSADLWTFTSSYLMGIDNLVVSRPAAVDAPPTARNDTFSMAIDTVLDQAAPGVLSNDADPEGAALTAVLVSGTSHGSVLLNADGSFSYMPAAGYTGSDSFTYAANDGATTGDAATVTITVAATGGTLFSDDFTRQQLPPWSGVLGTWTITNGVLQGSSGPLTYAIAWYDAPLWSDYSVGARIQLPAGAFGGGIGGRVNAATGARYTAAVYPEGSAGGSNVLKLVKFRDWTTWNYLPMRQVSLPGVGTGWHALAMTFKAARIQVYYDGVLMIDVTDNNYDSRAPYLSGGVSADLWTHTGSYLMGLDDMTVLP